ncbi:MAG: HEAT repeat domain-containing protein, partial [Planctomycetota bacterium]
GVTRGHAVRAVARVAQKAPLNHEQLSELLACLDDPDYGHVAGPAIQLLEKVEFANAHVPVIVGHLRGRDPALRRFAISALGRVDTTESASALLEVLHGENPDLQQRASVALSNLSSAVASIVDSLVEAPDAARAWALARMLQPQAFRLTREQIDRLAHAAGAYLGPGDPRAEALVAVLKDRYGAELLKACLSQIGVTKKKFGASEVANLLRPLVREGIELNVEARYELALAEIMRGTKNVVREARLRNLGLLALEPMAADPNFGFLARIKSEKGYLHAEDYYLIGCHFAEREAGDRILGGEMLRWLVHMFPDENISQAASHKLLMEGFPPPLREVKLAKRAARAGLRKAAVRRAEAKKAAAKRAAAEKVARAAAQKVAKKIAAKKAAAKKAAAKKAEEAIKRAKAAAKQAAKKVAAPKPKPVAKKATKKAAPKKKSAAPKKAAQKKPAKKKVAQKKAKKTAKNPAKKAAAKKAGKKATKKAPKKAAKKKGRR